MGKSRYKFGDDHMPHFLTCTIVNWLPLFASRYVVNIILDSLKFLRTKRDVKIFAYVIMENHIHLIAAGEQLSQKIGSFKSFTARQIVDHMKERHANDYLRLLRISKKAHKEDQQYQVWQEGNHPQELASEKIMQQKMEYIHNNPLDRGYVEDPTHWMYSSARNYAELETLLEIDMEW